MSMKKNTELYQKNIEKNISAIRSILRKLAMRNQPPLSLYEGILNQSSRQITSKWLAGRKYCRTFFVQEAFETLYPTKYTQISLCLDAMVNILDDLLDELLDKEVKMNYILEFLRIFSVFEKECPPEIHEVLKNYFDKLITLALAENYYQKQIIQERDLDKIVKDSADLLVCRGMDIDIFIEIALLKFRKKKIIHAIREMGRVFRAFNILKKDIKDIEYDRRNNIDTVVTLVLSKHHLNFAFYIDRVLDLLSESADLTRKDIDNFSRKERSFLPVYNFYQMIQKEKEEIAQLTQSL